MFRQSNRIAVTDCSEKVSAILAYIPAVSEYEILLRIPVGINFLTVGLGLLTSG